MARTISTGLLFSLALTFLIGVDASAQNRTERIRWTHDKPAEVASYQIYYGTTSRQYDQVIDAGVPPTDNSGAHYFDLVVPETATIYIAVTAIDFAERPSRYSDEKVREPSSGGSGSNPPPTANAGIQGFALWDATTDTIIDSDFQSGDVIDLATHPCTSIEIIGNTYLAQANQPGSVQKAFDGPLQSCTSAPASHENNKPFAWETDRGPGRFDCAASLTAPGFHQLIAVPFDGDDCTGASGPAVTLDFEIIGAGAGTTLGAPGRPTVID